MTLDQRLTDAARHLADGLVVPVVDLDSVRAQARRNQRRNAALTVASVVVAVGVVVASGATIGRDSSAPQPADPAPSPSSSVWSPASVTPQDVVKVPGAVLGSVGVAVGDTDTRLALWGYGGNVGLVVTQDGFRSATYADVPFQYGGQTGLVDVRVSSPRDDVFLVQAGNASVEWLVGVDGRVRRVTRVNSERMPRDPRLWFQCEGSWRATWCALDLDKATAYRWSGWDGSAVPPGRAVTPWGANPKPRSTYSSGRLEAWWGSGSGRRVRTLAAVRQGDYVLGCRPGLMALWSSASGGGTLKIHTSRDGGATWQVVSHGASGVEASWQVRCMPDGSFLVFSDKAVWRAEASGGPLRKVLSVTGGLTAPDGGIQLQLLGDLAVLAARGMAAVSQDAGRTWTTIQRWR
ncbi:MAG TPA: hypothetical protein VM097_03225 [Mycobacteriales bacterium]|nr:hypothetical protein [Mycobacteriales bacterium]